MALPPLASVTDLGAWIGSPLSGPDATRAEAVLAAVSSLVRSETGRTWTDDSDPPETVDVPQDVIAVVLQVAHRVIVNPLGFQAERVGDYSYQFPSSGPGSLRLEPHERAVLARFRTSQGGLWTLSTTRGDWHADTPYVPVVDAPPFPWYSALP